MNAEFFALAFGAALNAKLLTIDLPPARNLRARAMFLCVLIGAVGVAITIGLGRRAGRSRGCDQRPATRERGRRHDAGVVLLRSARLSSPGACPDGGSRPPPSKHAGRGKAEQDSWAQRVLGEPWPGMAVAIGALLGLPGALYLGALHNLVAGHWSTTAQVLGVIVFVIIEFALIIILPRCRHDPTLRGIRPSTNPGAVSVGNWLIDRRASNDSRFATLIATRRDGRVGPHHPAVLALHLIHQPG